MYLFHNKQIIFLKKMYDILVGNFTDIDKKWVYAK